jgi:DNA-binding LacI/PurR family transcriptional regulator
MLRNVVEHGIEDVARVAGVSTATVSRALRGLPNVTPATRGRVLAAAAELGYVGSPAAASLATGRTRTIGVLTPWVRRWYFANVVDGAERALRETNFDALLYRFEVSRGERRRVDPSVLRRRVDGILVVGLPMGESEVHDLATLGTPLIFVGSGPPGQLTVRLDDKRAGREATEHLLALGHRRIGHVTGDVDAMSEWAPGADRRAGWREALLTAGVTPDEDLVVQGDFELEAAREATVGLLREHPDVTAIFAASDEMAMGVVLAARSLGLRVPDDISVIGVDGHELGELIGLTTIAQPVQDQGTAAARLLLAMITGAPAPEQVIFPTDLVVRTSTAPPRASASR